MLRTAYSAPPENAKIPPMGKTISRSVRRTERTGPTILGTRELKIAASRVMPPSTISSYTTSASLMPYCGIASGVLSILIVSAERSFRRRFGYGSPVSGATEPVGFVVVVVDGTVVVVVLDVVVVVESAKEAVPITSVEPRPTASARASGRRIGKKLQRANVRGDDTAHFLGEPSLCDDGTSPLVVQRIPDNLADLIDFEEEAIVTHGRGDDVQGRGTFNELGQLILQTKRIEAIRIDAEHRGAALNGAERRSHSAASAAHIVMVHRLTQDDVAVCVKATSELLAVILQVGLDRVLAPRKDVLIILRSTRETSVQLIGRA